MARQADYHYALALCKVGRADEAVGKLDAYLATLDPESDASPRAHAMKEIAEAYQQIGRMEEAEGLLKGALEIQRKRGRFDHPDTLIMREALAMLYADTGRMDLATPIYEGLIDKAMAAGGELSAVMLHVISNHASNLVSSDPEASLKYFEIAYEGRNKALGEGHALSLETAHNYSIGLFQAGQQERGTEVLGEVVAAMEKTYVAGHPETMSSRLLLARMLSDRGLVDEAIAEEVKLMGARVPDEVGLRRQSLGYREAARAALRARDQEPDLFVRLESELLERDPSEEEAWGSLAYALFDRYRGAGDLDDLRAAVLCLSATGDGRRRGVGATVIAEWCAKDPAAADVPAPRLVVPGDAVWSYQEQTPAGKEWRGLDFDASSWPTGKGKFGYGDGDETTEIGFGGDPANKWVSACFRLEFEYDPVASGALSLGIVYDDGVVVYLDGREIARSLMPAGEIVPNTLAIARYTSIKEGIEEPFMVAPDAFFEGKRHVLAVQVHQTSPGSSDLAFKLRAIGEMPSRELVGEKISQTVMDKILAPAGKAQVHLRGRR
jgi:tetratricopeptide (TPR) repeat protein